MIIKSMIEAVLANVLEMYKYEDGTTTIRYNFDDDHHRNITFSAEGQYNFISMERSAEFRELEGMAIKVMNMANIQKVEKCEGYRMVTYGDDLDPSFIITDLQNNILESGTNGFSDGHIFTLKDWVDRETQSF